MEVWKDIIGYEGIYQVSNLGRVKSLSRLYYMKRNNCFAFKKEKIINHSLSGSGYHHVILQNNTEKKTRTLHSLVAEAFLNHTPCGHKLVVNHINFDKTDNRVENLEIITQRENANKKHIKSSSQYIGVSWCKRSKKWHSCIRINGKLNKLGYYISEIEAHLKYIEVLKQL